MISGAFPVADTVLGESVPFQLVDRVSDFLKSRLEQMIQTEPFLELYEFAAPDGSFFRAVDFANEQEALPGTITFRGFAYNSVKVTRSSISRSAEGRLQEMKVGVNDPTGLLIAYVKTHKGLSDSRVRLDVIHFDRLSNAEEAGTIIFRIKTATFIESPQAVVFNLGNPDVSGVGSPRKRFNRIRCHLDFQSRHVQDGKNYCNHPGDEFERQTFQGRDFNRFGWSLAGNGTPFTTSKSGILPSEDASVTDAVTSTDRICTLNHVAGANTRWNDANRFGPAIVKTISSVAAVDLFPDWQTKIDIPIAQVGFAQRDNPIAGLFMQSVNEPGNWMVWGLQRQAGTYVLFNRQTTSDVSTEPAMPAFAGQRAFRIARNTIDSTWDFYARVESLTERTFERLPNQPATWSLIGNASIPVTGDILCGIVIAADTTQPGNSDQTGHFFHLRFLRGGFKACDYSLDDCGERGQLHQFNGFLGLPDSISRTL